MTNAEFQEILETVMNDKCAGFEIKSEAHEYEFSAKFERKMRKMIKNFEKLRENAKKEMLSENEKEQELIKAMPGISVRSFRRAAVIALAAALLAALVACGVRWVIIWNETQNDVQGTLEVTFEIEKPQGQEREFEYKRPQTPKGFEIIKEFEEGNICEIVYQEIDNNVQILYSQSGNAEHAAISIDNDDDSFEAIQINGYSGYCVSEKEYCLIVWTDGISVFSISSNADFETTYKVAESVS